MKTHRFNEYYDLDQGRTETRSGIFLCNQFVHSYVFVPSFEMIENGDDPRRLEGIFVNSDHERLKVLYFISMDTILAYFNAVGRDYPNACRFKYNIKTCEYDFENYYLLSPKHPRQPK